MIDGEIFVLKANVSFMIEPIRRPLNKTHDIMV